MATMGRDQPGRDAGKVRILLRVLMALCVIGLVLSAAPLVIKSREYAQGNAAYRQVRKLAFTKEPREASEEAREGGAQCGSSAVDFAALTRINPDVVGWLSNDDATIDYPIVQGREHDFYLNHLFSGEENILGSLFLDYRNSKDYSDRNMVIYAHNMLDASMFASLTRYEDQSFYDSHSTMTLFTPNGDYMLELFAGITVDGTSDLIHLSFSDDDDFVSYVRDVESRSVFQSGVIVGEADRIVTLSTCSYSFENARFILFGRLVGFNEHAPGVCSGGLD